MISDFFLVAVQPATALTDWITSLFDGSLVGGGVFLTIGIIGAVLLLISVLLDGIFDFFDFGDGPLSLTTIAAFTAIFGFSAFALVGAGVSVGASGALGAVAGLLGGFGAWWLSKTISKAESNTSASIDDFVNAQGVVTLEIPGGQGLGEIALTIHGERVSLAATADHKIERGTQVEVAHALSATAVKVRRADAGTAEQ